MTTIPRERNRQCLGRIMKKMWLWSWVWCRWRRWWWRCCSGEWHGNDSGKGDTDILQKMVVFQRCSWQNQKGCVPQGYWEWEMDWKQNAVLPCTKSAASGCQCIVAYVSLWGPGAAIVFGIASPQRSYDGRIYPCCWSQLSDPRPHERFQKYLFRMWQLCLYANNQNGCEGQGWTRFQKCHRWVILKQIPW